MLLQSDPLAEPVRTTLRSLGPGSTAVVVAVDGSGPESARLLDLGFVPGTRIQVVKRAPLGDPVMYDVRGARFCLRRSEAERIRVRPV